MPTEKLLPATPENVTQTLDWLKYVECGGGTNPLPGLLMALQLRPDAIYLLTDGKFDPQIVWEVTQAEPLGADSDLHDQFCQPHRRKAAQADRQGNRRQLSVCTLKESAARRCLSRRQR